MRIANNQTNWAQKYRPQQLEDMILTPAVMQKLTTIRDKQTGLHLLLYGTAGTGKTTAAHLINPDGNFFLNCSLDNGVNTVEKIVKGCSSSMYEEGLRIVILDEADYLTEKAQAAMRGVIEKFSSENLFVFTVNEKSRLIDPLHSRLHAIDFSHLNGNMEIMQSMVDRAIKVLENEGVNVNKAVVDTIVRECYPDMRSVLTRLQAESLII